ncbi:hypothetical protein ACTMU2_17350 [Cupriavidus basilensis]
METTHEVLYGGRRPSQPRLLYFPSTEGIHGSGILGKGDVMARSLDARYEADTPQAFLNGNQALIRMMVEQMRSDGEAGLRTKAFVTGYPGSPLGSIDIALRQAKRTLDAHGITLCAAQNEEFAVTMLSGTQMLDEHPHPDVDGVVGYWYGKGPGLDRSGDALKHANFAGTSRHGAVVILSGEDHEAKSSTVPYQQEFSFEHHGIPVLYIPRASRSSWTTAFTPPHFRASPDAGWH